MDNPRLIDSGTATSNHNVMYGGSPLAGGGSGRYVVYAVTFNGSGFIGFVSLSEGAVSSMYAGDNILTLFFSSTTGKLCIKASVATSFAYNVVRIW